MPTQFIVVMAQLNLLVGALDANTHAVIEAAKRAIDEHSADIVVFPELTLTGLPSRGFAAAP
jgi:NAD+ synthase (glutamine-hydrolysing)